MELVETKTNLFNAPDKYYFAHCISSDFKLGAGIAVEFCRRFNTRAELIREYQNPRHATCLLTSRTLNLVTKRNYWDKPTLDSMRRALESMKQVCSDNDIRFVAMPAIGCGLDRLNWSEVRQVIERVFDDTDIRIVVCFL